MSSHQPGGRAPLFPARQIHCSLSLGAWPVLEDAVCAQGFGLPCTKLLEAIYRIGHHANPSTSQADISSVFLFQVGHVTRLRFDRGTGSTNQYPMFLIFVHFLSYCHERPPGSVLLDDWRRLPLQNEQRFRLRGPRPRECTRHLSYQPPASPENTKGRQGCRI